MPPSLKERPSTSLNAKRQISAVEHVYYFGSKVLDHHIMTHERGLHVKGIFLSSVEVGESSMQFGLAFGMRVIDPSNPPLEELYALSENNRPMRRAIRRLWQACESVDPLRSQPGLSPQLLLKSYEFLKRRATNFQ